MDANSPIKFEEFKKEERFKRLERQLKLAFVKQMEQIKAGEDKGYSSNFSPTWPSLSTINPDGMDTSCTNGPSLHVSRVESEVVSYSTNLRKMLPGHKIERKPMATSSVKKFPLNEMDKDCVIMPPPPVNAVFSNRKTIRNNPKKTLEVQNSRKRGTDSETCSSLKKQSLNSSVTCDENNINFKESDSENSKSYKVFSRWRVLINDQGQLIIKGTLECGKIARSKPVIQKLTNTKVQSIYKHIYILDGTLVDERNELPDYVCGKFHNGFPDDWENVYQLWRNYIAEGSKVTFRWPTPITDSDDDLNSEISDLTYYKSKQSPNTEHALAVSNSNAGSSLGYHSRTQSESNQNVENSKEENNVASSIQSTSQKVNDSGHSSESKEVTADNTERSVESSKESLNLVNLNTSDSNLKNTSYLHEIIREDKVRAILYNLGDRNCPPQYLDKFIELIDCLKYILSYTPSNSEADNKNEISSPSKKVTEGCQKCNSSISFSEAQENTSNQCNKIDRNNKGEKSKDIDKPEDYSENCKQAENQIQLKSVHSDDVHSNSSDSDAYMGIPHISLSHLIRNKPKRSPRYQHRKTCKQGQNVDKQIEEPIQNQNVKKQYDSSISVTEDESSIMYSQFLTSNKKSQNKSEQKSKPIIKSYEQVHIDVKLKRPFKAQNLPPSDVSILDETLLKNHPKANPNTVTIHNQAKNHSEEEKENENALEHHFLTYDSEDFIGEEEDAKNDVQLAVSNSKNKDKNKNSEVKEKRKVEGTELKKQEKRSKLSYWEGERAPVYEKRKGSTKEITSVHERFGSKENPKVLTSWVPCVVYNDELKKNCNLIFEGKLLNEAGHILHRKYVTDSIRERHSAKLIETVNNEFFTLVGDISDTKHVVPKELLKQCRTGCPSRIKEFCEEWKSLRPVIEKEDDNKITNLHNASIDQIKLPISSRGRRILPPLNYWKGERTLTKDNNVVYTPGHTVESSQIRQSSASKKTGTLSEQRSQNNNKEEVNSRVIKSSTKPSNTADDLDNLEPKSRQLKNRLAQKLKYLSSDSETSEPSNKKAFRKPMDSRKASKTQGILQTQPGGSEILTESAYNVKLRNRQKTDKGNSQNDANPNDKKVRVPAKKLSEASTWTYVKEPYQDMLSDDQSSVFNT